MFQQPDKETHEPVSDNVDEVIADLLAIEEAAVVETLNPLLRKAAEAADGGLPAHAR